MITGKMSFTDQAKNDKKLRARLLDMATNLEANGLPKTKESLNDMYDVYNKLYGKNKKPTNCIYCRIAVRDYLYKAVALLEIKAPIKKVAKAKAKAPAKRKAPGKGPAKPKKRQATK
jgi:hypothetical protein